MNTDLRVLDLLLGEGDQERRERLRRRVAEDPKMALELAETADLLEHFRSLTVQPTGRVERILSIRTRAHRISRSTARGRLPWWGRLLGVGAVAAATLAVLSLDPLGLAHPGAPQQTPQADWTPAIAAIVVQTVAVTPILLDPVYPVLPVDEPRFKIAFDHIARLNRASAFDLSVNALNDRDLARLQFRNRDSTEERRRAILATGGNPDMDDRVQELANIVARRISDRIDGGDADVLETSLDLRALLASGSNMRLGSHRETVRRCADWLEAQLDDLNSSELASALSALTDLAVLEGGRLGEVVGKHTLRLADETVTKPEILDGEHRRLRPSLLSSAVPVASLADAGWLFRLAPAFGVPPDRAHRARQLVLAHIDERLQEREQPSLLAAKLYGFGDMVIRDELDRRLKMWQTSNLDYVTIYHLAWSRFPVRPGWARFQQELRRLSARPTPEGAGDAGALLLCLAMNFAAPGSAEMVLSQL